MKAIIFFFLSLVTLVSYSSVDLPYPEQDLIAYKALQPKASLLVYTDIDCGYCRKLHNEIPDLNASGVSVYYAPFPRKGLNSKSYKKFATVYCSEDRQKALTKMKSNFVLPNKSCDNPVKTIYEDGLAKGVRGTPMVLTQDNRTLGGFKPAEEIVKDLGLDFVSASEAQRQAFAPLYFTQTTIPLTYYKANKRIPLYLQPSHEQKKAWGMGRNSVKVMSIIAEADGQQWAGTEHKGRVFYAPVKDLTKLTEKHEYDTQKIVATNYVSVRDTNIYLAPDKASPALDQFPANRYTRFTFKYENNDTKWLGYEQQGVKYFIASQDLELKK